MGHSHEHRPYVSRREFLRRSAVVGAATAAGPWFWRQLAYAADAPVSQLHVTYGADAAREAIVSWMTPAPVAQPFVQLGAERVAGRTVQYAGYPGFFHHATLRRLTPSTAYSYRVGGVAASFRTGPAGRTPFTFTAFGDQGVDGDGALPSGIDVTMPPNQASANTKLAQSLKPAFHLIVGDLAYANGNQTVWDRWFRMIEPMARTTPWMPTIGNHEIEALLGSLTGGGDDSWGKWGYDPYRTRFLLPGNGFSDLQNCFYAFRYGSVQFLMLDNNDVNTEIAGNIGYTAGRQKVWAERTLAAARNDTSIDFIVVGMHQCAFSSSTKHGVDEGVQAAWFPLFQKYSVDLVLQGHDHTYERTHAMRHATVVQDKPPYRTDAGTVYVVCGNGGAVQEPFNPIQPPWSAFRRALQIGTLKIDVEPDAPGNMKRLRLTELWALNGQPIERDIVLERPRPAVLAASAAAAAPAPAARPTEVLPVTGGPAGTAIVGVAAAAGAIATRVLLGEAAKEAVSDHS